MTRAATAVLTGGVALLERATGYTLGSLLLVTPEAMANRTPCREWDLRALLVHLNDSLLALHSAVAEGYLELDPAADTGDADGSGEPATNPAGAVRGHARQMIGAWARPGLPGEIWIADRVLGSDVVAAAGAVEVAVHGWDIARACGVDRPIPPALAEELLELCPLLVGDADRPGRFGPPADPSRWARPGDRLVAFLGRCPC